MASGRDTAETFDLTRFPELFPRYYIAPALPAAPSGRPAQGGNRSISV